jgi:beta-glucanase (GH16 family)
MKPKHLFLFIAATVVTLMFGLVSCGDRQAVVDSSEASIESALDPGPPSVVTTLSFSDHTWWVKASSNKVGPGPNLFSDSPNNVWVDNLGRLHLRITKVKGRWYCAEVVSMESFGYGTYRFYLDSPVGTLDPNVVLGLFTWNDDPTDDNREIDIEFSRWASANNLNAQYVVQPYTLPQNILRFQLPTTITQSTHSFEWRIDSVTFKSIKGLNASPPDPSDLVQQWKCIGTIPHAGGENARMNLWLFRGRAPSNGQEAEVIVNRFEIVL